MLYVILFLWSDYFGIFIGIFFFFKQKTAYEMRISDWSSDVCSSDLTDRLGAGPTHLDAVVLGGIVARREHRARAVQQTGCKVEIGRASCRERVSQYV